MSTYYFLVCERHRIVSRVIGGRSFPDRWWSNDEGELEQFLEAHGDCKAVLVNEHSDRVYEYDEIPLPKAQHGQEDHLAPIPPEAV